MRFTSDLMTSVDLFWGVCSRVDIKRHIINQFSSLFFPFFLFFFLSVFPPFPFLLLLLLFLLLLLQYAFHNSEQ